MKKLLLAALVGVVIVEVLLLSRRDGSFGAPAVPLRRETPTAARPEGPSPEPGAPRELELPRELHAPLARGASLFGARIVHDASAEDAATPPADAVPTLTLAEAPPVPDVPALEVVPLEFTVFEPPYDAHLIPAAVLREAQAATRSVRERVLADDGSAGEISRWLVTQPEHVTERYLARATLDVGLQAWVHMSDEPGLPQIKHGRVLLYDPRRGTLAPEVITLATRWSGSDADELPKLLGQADLDRDGRAELVVHERAYNGPDTARSHRHWIGFSPDRRPRTLLRLNVDAYVGWHGWPPGGFETRVIPVSASELWVEAWHRASADGARIPIGYTVYDRAWPGADFAPRFEVVNPDTPGDHGHGYTTEAWRRAPASFGVKLALGALAAQEAPPPLDAPALEIEPLEFTFFEPPYDATAIPRAVLDDARAFCTEILDEFGEDDWFHQMPPERRERYLAVAELHAGIQAWVHMPLHPMGTAPDLGRLLLFDTHRGVLLPEHLTLETRWNDVHPTRLPEVLGRADLDLDGVPELAAREIDHNGTVQHDIYWHWFRVDAARGVAETFLSQEFARGWFEPRIEGDIHARLIPLSGTELRAEAWFEPYAEYDVPPRSLGHTLFARPDHESAWRAVDEVHNAWASITPYEDFTSFRVSRLLGWDVHVERRDAGR